jgi:hypothetical protein
METNELIKKIEELEVIIPAETNKWTNFVCHSFFITTIQFIKNYIGQDTEFYRTLNEYGSTKVSGSETDKAWAAKKVLKSIKDYLHLNLDLNKTEAYNIKIDIISDFMVQAIELASDKKFHPAAAGILMGASLEEFLKKLAEEKEIDLTGIKLTIDPISKRLYEMQIISKQDLKDITSWAGLRNDATHGNFESVNDRSRILNAIEGVNLFMRKHNI